MKISRLIFFVVGAACSFHSAFAAPAIAEPAPFADQLSGDWGGARTKLENRGIAVSLDYTGDVWSVVDGGVKRRSSYLDLIELRTTIDGEKLYGIKGNTVSVSVIRSNGATTNGSHVGSTQGIDNDEVAVNGTRLFEAWMNQEFLDGRIAVLVGLHDLNSEFATTPVSDNFIKPTMQIGQSFAQSGSNGPSIFPTTSLAGRVKVKPTANSYVAAAVYDGVPGDTDHPRSNPIVFGDKDGLLLVGEAGYIWPTSQQEEANKLALGVWHYTAPREDQATSGQLHNPEGAYVVSSYEFYADKVKGRSVAAFWRGGVADGDVSQVSWDYTAGLVGRGWVPTRSKGEIGLGISVAHNADKYMTAQEAAGTAVDRNEMGYELYYRDTVARGVTLQPDVQYIVNPGTDRTTKDALVVGLRTAVSF